MLQLAGFVAHGRLAGREPDDVGVEVFQAELQLVVVEALRPAPEAAALERFHDLSSSSRLSLQKRHQAADRLGIGVPLEANPASADQLDLDPRRGALDDNRAGAEEGAGSDEDAAADGSGEA